ncbi:DNA polymerase [Glaciibacter psychrotolerans]|uniref:DNA-directed DNA polymerase n=1 Tax=Glaciibacter psychrotolerans TaxID=670054 RepID=A0A7Z0J5L3_9MICO|nr:DNA polymerase [Leifsonia psychrotolerans]NYJ19612.1 DNA polymerase I-like protein with 3'-5' exonuclease and polymerase domains [Leifsonia psychrotolerans]
MTSARHEQLWRPRQAQGWRVDIELLESELASHQALRAQAARELGLDVLDESASGATRTHDWLQRVGIHVTNHDGAPSLARSDADRTIVPPTQAAHLVWAQFREARHIGARLSTLGQFEHYRKGDRVFPQLVLHHAKTGRGTILRPSLQNTTGALRPLLLAEPGHALVALDLSQVEPRVAAALSGDSSMRAAILAGDLYTDLALKVRGDAGARSLFKTGLLSVLYGAGAKGLAQRLNCEVPEATAIIADIWGAFPGLAAYAERLKAEMRAGTAELTIGGRPIPRPSVGKEYAVLNTRIQASAADVFYAGIMRVAAVLGAESLWLPFHDELIVMVPTDDADHAADVLREKMTEHRGGIPITGEPHILGPAWQKS